MKRMGSFPRIGLPAILVSSWLFGCSPGITAPGEAQIGCTSTPQCPLGWTCNEKISRCVEAEKIDSDAPSILGEVSLTPAVLKEGATATLSFEASEELSELPSVTIKAGVERYFTADETASTGTHYAFVFKATLDLPQDVDCPITIVLTDRSGNTSGNLSGKSLRFDFVQPTVSKIAVEGSPAKIGGAVQVSFTASEKIMSAPLVKLGAEDSGFWQTMLEDPSSQGLDYVYSYAAQEGDPQDPAGVGFTISLEDEAGNQALLDSQEAKVVFDFAPPALDGEPVVAPLLAKQGTLVTVSFRTLEEIASDPVVTLDGQAMDRGSGTGTSFTYTHIAQESDGEGEKPISIALIDLAGNESGPISVTSMVRFDFQSPTLLGEVVFDKPSGIYRSGETIIASFNASEILDSSLLTARLATSPFRDLPCSATGESSYSCALDSPLSGTETPQGPVGLTIQLADAAGNTGYGSTTVGLDFKPPTLVWGSPSSFTFRAGEKLVYTLSVSEPLQGTPGRPVIHVFRDGVEQLAFFDETPASETATSFTYTKAVDGSVPEGNYSVEADLIDQAGNWRWNEAGSGFGVDKTPPSITAVSVTTSNASPALATNGNRVTAVFDVEEFLSAAPVVTLSGIEKKMELMSRTGDGPYRYTYQCSVESIDSDGEKIVTAAASDAAGNVSVQEIGSVTYDLTPPSIVPSSEGLALLPFPGCLLEAVTKVTLQTRARVSFTASELLLKDQDPVLAVTPSQGSWTFQKVSSAGSLYVFEVLLAGGSPAQGSHKLQVTLTDLAGNASSPQDLILPAPGLNVDTVSPTPIDDAGNDRILYRRIPWGSTSTSGAKEFTAATLPTCTSGSPAVEPDSTVIFWDSSKISTAARIGQATADVNGCFAEITLVRADRPAVFISQLDQAGNLDSSTATEIKTQEWIATMGYKVAGSDFENPHRFETSNWFSNTFLQGRVAEAGAADGLGRVDQPYLKIKGAGSWREQRFDGAIPQLSELAMVYDSMRGTTVVFGGWRAGVSSLTWEWNGFNWKQISLSDPEGDGDPVARAGHAMAFDGRRGRTVLFGGCVGGSLSSCSDLVGDTWEYDGESWEQRNPLHSPAARYSHAMAYDSLRGKVVLFGGDDGAANAETWEWDGEDWTEIVTATAPAARYSHAMVFHGTVTQGKILLFGGCTSGDCTAFATGTWEYDGTNWAPQSPSTSPSSRYQHVMACDPTRKTGPVTVLHGGYDGSGDCDGSGGSTCSGTWEWDGTTWTRKSPTNPGEAQLRHAAAFDSARGRVVLFGGAAVGESTWEYDGSTWVKLSPKDPEDDAGPGLRNNLAMAFDAGRHRAVIFGGYNGLAISDTWEWDGVSWTKCVSGNAACDYSDPEGDGAPASRSGAAMAPDSSGRLLLFGGTSSLMSTCEGGTGYRCGGIWLWGGTSWTRCTTASGFCLLSDGTDGNPSARTRHAMAYDSSQKRTVLFGGSDASGPRNDTWEWDGTTHDWVRRSPASSPTPRFAHAMAYDSGRSLPRTVLFGGCTNSECSALSNETWEWDSVTGTWAKIEPVDPEGDGSPTARSGHTMVYDTQRQRVVLYGGDDGLQNGELWEWNGASWAKRVVGDPEADGAPEARAQHGAAYDSTRNRMLLFGGGSAGYLGDTWEWSSGYASRPAQIMRASFADAGLRATPEWQSATFRMDAGGTGYSGATGYLGAQLKVWEAGAWQNRFSSTTFSPASPGALEWETTDPLQIERLFVGPKQQLGMAVVPRYDNSRGTAAEIAVDYAQVTVRYRLP
jgi:hypothetical protein